MQSQNCWAISIPTNRRDHVKFNETISVFVGEIFAHFFVSIQKHFVEHKMFTNYHFATTIKLSKAQYNAIQIVATINDEGKSG